MGAVTQSPADTPEAVDTLVRVRGLTVEFDIGGGLAGSSGTLRAVGGVDLDIRRGETLGLVGESGCGKSTLGRALLRLVPITEGSVEIDGTDIADLKGRRLREQRRHMQMVFQDPYASLNPRQSVERLLAEPMRAHGLASRGDVRAKVTDLLDRVGLPASAADRYPHEFSGGQRQRIGLARALSLDPSLLVADEPVSALDVSVQAQILNLLLELQEQMGLTYLFISHDLSVVRHVADRVAVMYLGRIVEVIDADDLDRAAHPYTRALLSAVPLPDPARERTRERIVLGGDPPNAAAMPTGCAFHPRCPVVQESRCATELPLLRPMVSGSTALADEAEGDAVDTAGVEHTSVEHEAACHYAERG